MNTLPKNKIFNSYMYFVLIIVIFILLVIYFYYNYYKINVYFSNIDHGKIIIKKYHLHYLNSLKIIEKNARGCFSNKQCINHYLNNVTNFTQIEKRIIRYIIEFISNKIIIIFPKFPSYQWNFMKTTQIIEDGMPHTIHNFIILPENFLNDMIKLFKINKMKCIMRYGKTLLHEKIHTMQKENIRKFEKLYFNYFNLIKINNIENIKYRKYKRSNPDGLYENWLYPFKKNKYIRPFAILKNSKNTSISNVSYLGEIYIRNNSEITSTNNIIQLHNQGEHIRLFGNISDIYHPNEVSAELISRIIMYKIGLYRYYPNCLAEKHIFNWLRYNYI